MRPGPEVRIGGACDPRFADVRDAFAHNFAAHGEIGASVCVIVDDHVVVDLAGGWADLASITPWRHDTLANVYSVGKGLTSVCVARLIGERAIDPDLPVAAYWPEFAAAGKASITVAQLMGHQAGLPALRDPLPHDAMLDWEMMTEALAAEAPWWLPGSAHGYHVNTFGFLVGELVRRVTGTTVGRYLRDQISGPLGADVHIGLPESEDHRVAEIVWDFASPDIDAATLTDYQRMAFNAYFNPGGASGVGFVNSRAWRAAEIPSTNAHATARGLARVYRALVGGGAAGGMPVVDMGALRRATSEQSGGDDLILRRPSRFGLGFQLTQPERPLGPGPSGFGHFGAGGSLGFCDPDAGLAFGYVMNQMGPSWQNPRNRALMAATYECLGAGAGAGAGP